jgi:hypothetical protein
MHSAPRLRSLLLGRQREGQLVAGLRGLLFGLSDALGHLVKPAQRASSPGQLSGRNGACSGAQSAHPGASGSADCRCTPQPGQQSETSGSEGSPSAAAATWRLRDCAPAALAGRGARDGPAQLAACHVSARVCSGPAAAARATAGGADTAAPQRRASAAKPHSRRAAKVCAMGLHCIFRSAAPTTRAGRATEGAEAYQQTQKTTCKRGRATTQLAATRPRVGCSTRARRCSQLRATAAPRSRKAACPPPLPRRRRGSRAC